MRFYGIVSVDWSDFRRGHEENSIHSDQIDSVRDSFRASIGAVYLRRQRQFASGVVITGPVFKTIRRLPRQGPASLRLHLDAAQQVSHRLPSQQVRCASAVITFRKRQRAVEGSSHNANAHGTDQDGATIKCARHDGRAGTRWAEDVFGGHSEVCVLDMRPRAGRVASGGDVTEHLERAKGVALNICNCDEENHDGVGGLVGAGSCGPADDALEVCTFKTPTSAVGGPYLCFESVEGERIGRIFLTFSPLSTHSSPSSVAVVLSPGAPFSSQLATPPGSENTRLASGSPCPLKNGSKNSLCSGFPVKFNGVKPKPVENIVSEAAGSTLYISSTSMAASTKLPPAPPRDGGI